MEKYTRIALPEDDYITLLGIALYVFNSNNSFIIENILHVKKDEADWYELIDDEKGKVINTLKEILTDSHEIYKLFKSIKEKRNRIVHSFPITESKNHQQRLQTKSKIKDGSKQELISEKYLVEFIQENDKLSNMLYQLRDNILKKQ